MMGVVMQENPTGCRGPLHQIVQSGAEAIMKMVGANNSFIRLPFTNRAFLSAILYLGIGSSIIAFTFN